MYESILDRIGHTPLVRLNLSRLCNINLFVKLEFFNPTGSVKDRAAFYIIEKLLRNVEINKNTTLIESSSGNFGIALSAYCKKNGLKFICVVDPNITQLNEVLIRSLDAIVIKVHEPDDNGGYLINRLKKVNEIIKSTPNSYWVNQYSNPYNAEVYYHTLGDEICSEVDNIDYVFIGVSSGGTITGVSQKVKEVYPKAKIIAVDSIGSVIFGGMAKKRYLPGMGSSIVPEILKNAKIDDVVMISEKDAVKACHEVLYECSILAGGSSGSVICGMEKYFKDKHFTKKPNVITVFADRGDRYANTIYNDKWYKSFLEEDLAIQVSKY